MAHGVLVSTLAYLSRGVGLARPQPSKLKFGVNVIITPDTSRAFFVALNDLLASSGIEVFRRAYAFLQI